VFWGFLAVTGLTGVLHRPDRCGASLWKSPSFASRDRSDRWCSPVRPVLVPTVDSRFGVPLVLGSVRLEVGS
jgi:hypothetical protein